MPVRVRTRRYRRRRSGAVGRSVSGMDCDPSGHMRDYPQLLGGDLRPSPRCIWMRGDRYLHLATIDVVAVVGARAASHGRRSSRRERDCRSISPAPASSWSAASRAASTRPRIAARSTPAADRRRARLGHRRGLSRRARASFSERIAAQGLLVTRVSAGHRAPKTITFRCATASSAACRGGRGGRGTEKSGSLITRAWPPSGP